MGGGFGCIVTAVTMEHIIYGHSVNTDACHTLSYKCPVVLAFAGIMPLRY